MQHSLSKKFMIIYLTFVNMGGAVSSGQDNDELVDNLIEWGYIRTKKVEQVFRSVDRADYVLSSHRENAYKDIAWKHGNLHLSAPCVYSEVMEALSLEPGLSFLNLGSGTGYLSTMAGLILNQHGTNHGIELREDCLRYAYERLEEFKQNSLALDEFDFCEPLFIQGNCLSIVPGRQYDRVYCGAACPENHETFIKQFVRVGGILVMPFKDHLLRIQRVDENIWTQQTMLPVSFATLVVPTSEEHNLLHLPECDPLSLQELCRSKIRCRLRQNIWHAHSGLEITKPLLPTRQKPSPPQRTLRRFVIPIFEQSDDVSSEEEEEYSGRAGLFLNVDAHPGEAITTTLQLVRAVIQPNQNESRQNWNEVRHDENNRTYNVESVDLDLDSNDDEGSCNKAESAMNVDVNTSSENDTEMTSEVSKNQNVKQNERTTIQDGNTAESYSKISESDSDAEQENAFVQRKKIAKREKADSGIVEDVNITNDDGSSSSNTNHSETDSEIEIGSSTNGVEAMDVDLYDIMRNNKSCRNSYNSHSTLSDTTCSEEVPIAHYVDSNAFTTYMKDKIHQLPLPFSLKLYINYNRKL